MISLRHLHLKSCGHLKLKIYEIEVIISVLTSPQKTPGYPLSCFLLQWNIAPSFLHPNRKSRSHCRLFFFCLSISCNSSKYFPNSSVLLFPHYHCPRWGSHYFSSGIWKHLMFSPLFLSRSFCSTTVTVLYIKWDQPTRPMKLKSQEGRGRWKSSFLLSCANYCSMWQGLRINAGLEKFQMS